MTEQTVPAERPRCDEHGVVMVERFEERGSLMIPTGMFYCLRCKAAPERDGLDTMSERAEWGCP